MTARNLYENPCISEYFSWKIKWLDLVKMKCPFIQYTNLWKIYNYAYQYSMLLIYILYDYKFM